MKTFITSRTSKPMHIQMRKDARTAIYRAVFGDQTTQSSNLPWADPSRRLPQEWTAQGAWGIFQAYKAEAQLSREAQIEIASALKVDLKEVL